MEYGIGIRLNRSFAETVGQVRAALKDQGFGVLTEIDVQATLREKLGEAMEPYLILGACNPQLAHRALGVDRQIGLLLPCNVEALDPHVMLSVTGQGALAPVAQEASRRLTVALCALET
jgi:uncharacterized protein (DUF302 family)